MLPEFLLTVENSMHDMARDDFHLLNGVQDCDKDMCPCSASSNGHMRTQSPHQQQQQSHPQTPSPNAPQLQHSAERSPLMSVAATKEADSPGIPYDGPIKLEDTQNCDLFSSPTKWPPPSSPLANNHGLHQSLAHPHHHQHPQHSQHHHQNSHHHRVSSSGISSTTSHHHHHHHHAALHTSRKLDSTQLLQGSEDPMICHGAATDDDHPADEFKSLIASVSAKQHQQHHSQQQHQQHNQQHHQQHREQHHQQHHQQHHLQQQLQHSDRLEAPGLLINPLALKTKTSAAAPSASSCLESVGLQVKRQPQNGCSSLTKQQLKVKAGLMSSAAAAKQQQTATGNPNPGAYSGAASASTGMAASRSKPQRPPPKVPAAPKKKGAIKLRFHHQALPPEYLSHYEATQGHLAGVQRKDPPATAKGSQAAPSSSSSSSIKISQTVKLPPPKSAHENVRSWLQKIAEIQRTAQQQRQQHPAQEQTPKAPPPASAGHDLNNNNQLSRMQPLPSGAAPLKIPPVVEPCAPPAAKRVINYSDLPYMGEITLNNCKPRRGRKPKKTDICHLIYKNYGTIFPGTPKNAFAFARAQAQAQAASLAGVANSRKVPEVMPARSRSQRPGAAEEQPLNLCLRDQSLGDFYSLSSDGDEDEDEEADGRGSEAEEETSLSNCTTPPPTPSGDYLTDSLLAASMRSALPSSLGGAAEQPQRTPAAEESGGSLLQIPSTETSLPASPSSSGGTATTTTTANNLVLHPSLSVYYQRLIQSGTLLQQHGGTPYEMIHKDNQLALKIPIPSGLFVTPPKQEKSSPKPPALEYPEPMSTPSSIKSEASTNGTVNSGPTGHLQVAPAPLAKRKRSAIFIPPIPEGGDNTSIPATEVSICKFKFTGGAKPSLQEKKMLSVDSDGNYRYYSGTGDKANRGYEFFPRESLHQSGLIPGMQLPMAPVYVTEKITADLAAPSSGLSDELLQIPEAMADASSLLGVAATQHYHPGGANLMQPPRPVGPGDISPPLATAKLMVGERKKKSRRSMQREKLEKTFKERGFLIQTQQLESAEGATYCKFRQLKKFTRYLFRNWKDYLPGDVQQANVAAAAAAAAAAALSKYHGDGQVGGGANGVGGDVPTTPRAPSQHGFESILSSHAFCQPAEGARIAAEEATEATRPSLASVGGGGTPQPQSGVVVEPAS